MRFNKRYKKRKERNNRLYILMAVIFLLVISLVFKLIKLQITNSDYYSAMASSQHSVYDELEPERGRIFIQDDRQEDSELYPLAANKDFALLYAVPSEVAEPEKIADELYKLFDEQNVLSEVENMIEEDEYFLELLKDREIEDLPEAEQQFIQVKKELEMETRKREIIDNYLFKLTKKKDPYEPLKRKVNENDLAVILNFGFKGIYYNLEPFRYYPEKNIGSHFLGFVGFEGSKMAGRYGLEGFFDTELSGIPGTVKGEKSGQGGVVIINNREFIQAQDGSDLILTINRSIQFEVCRQLSEAIGQYGADGGSVIVMEPFSGEIIAMCSLPDYDPNNYNKVEDSRVFNNPAIFDAYEPGSIFKSVTMAAGIDSGAIGPDTIYEDKGYRMIEGWDKPIKNSDFETHGGYGWVDMVTVLEESLNTGTIFIVDKIGPDVFSKYVKDFGFGEKTGIELETEGLSNIVNLNRSRIRPVEAATASFGQGITATPLQIISAYSAIANGGILMKPFLVKEMVYSDGRREITQSKQIRRVISDKAAYQVSGMLVKVVDGGHAIHAGVDGYFVAGKTGTAQVADTEKGGYSEENTIHTFVGFAPIEEPRFVMLVKLDHPANVKYAASSAAPLFGQLAEFILNYYQVSKER